MYQEKEITPMLVFAIFSATLGMFQFGFNTGVMNAPQKVLEEYISNVYKSRTGNWISEELRDLIWSIVVSVFAIGGMIGGILAPTMANSCGRKTGLILNNTVAVLGVTLMSSSQLSQSIESLVAGRFFIGLNCGLSTALVPMYLTEISTVNVRGALGTVSQLGVTLGLLFSQVLGLKELLGTNENWPFLFAFSFIPAILQLIMLPFCPESPRYLLLTCGRLNEARVALRRLRNEADIEIDIEEMRAESQAQHEEISKYGRLFSFRDLFNHPWLRAPLIIGIMMQLSQQLSGINAIFYYSTNIFISAEVSENYAVYATIGVGAIMVVMALISMPLMDRVGRRTLHLYGLAGMFLASIFLTISLLVKFLYDWMKYISVVSILFYTLFFGIGPSSIPWMITAELFTQDTRPTAMSVAVLVNWLTNFAVGLTFPLMKRVLQNYLFLPFTVFLAIFWIFTYKKLPETKNRTFEEIASLFRPVTFGGVAGLAGDFGCSVSNMGCLGTGSITEGTSETHNADSGTLGTGQQKAYQTQPDRFRFDQNMQHSNHNHNSHYHRHSQHGISTGDKDDDDLHFHHSAKLVSTNHRDSGCNTANIPHTSFTSIALNLSTNDQQPLIVDDHHYHYHHQHHRYQNHMHLHGGNHLSEPGDHTVERSLALKTSPINHRTTSFMANGRNSNACRCCIEQVDISQTEKQTLKCRHSTLGSFKTNCQSFPHLAHASQVDLDIDDIADDEDCAIPSRNNHREQYNHDEYERRSRTLTKSYNKPLRNVDYSVDGHQIQPSSSISNLNITSLDQRRFFVASNLDTEMNQRL